MLLTEWDWDKYVEVQRREALEEGREEIARNALAKGFSPEAISDITSIDTQTIQRLAAL